jgi:hypothetical protein
MRGIVPQATVDFGQIIEPHDVNPPSPPETWACQARRAPLLGLGAFSRRWPGRRAAGSDQRLRCCGGWPVADLPVAELNHPPRSVGAAGQIDGDERQAEPGDSGRKTRHVSVGRG